MSLGGMSSNLVLPQQLLNTVHNMSGMPNELAMLLQPQLQGMSPLQMASVDPALMQQLNDNLPAEQLAAAQQHLNLTADQVRTALTGSSAARVLLSRIRAIVAFPKLSAHVAILCAKGNRHH